MKRKKSVELSFELLLVALLAGAAGPARAGNVAVASGAVAVAATNALSLPEVLRLALRHNPELARAGYRVRVADGQARQAGLWANPDLDLSAEDWPAGQRFSQSKAMVGVSQTVPFPGKKPLERQAARAGVRVTEMELRQRQTELEREIKVAFYRVLASERRREISQELVELARAVADTARKRVEAGAAGMQEQLRAEVEQERAQTEQVEVSREIIAARQTLVTLLGRPDLKDAPLAGTLSEGVNTSPAEENPGVWLNSHPRVVVGRAAQERAGLQVRRARLEPAPDVKLGVAGGREGGTGAGLVEFRLSVPLPFWDHGKGRVQEAQAQAALAGTDLTAIEQQLLKEWNDAQARFHAASAQVSNFRGRILPKSEAALKLVREGFDNGKFGFMDLLDTQRTMAEARLAYQEKLFELNAAQAQLESLRATSQIESTTSQSPGTH
jgi:cobalt-zinc-cadmium efflux system outer membrane protein